jgi:hypothetical protein
MAEIIEWIINNGWIIDKNDKMWRKQVNILKLHRGEAIRHKKITEYYELNKHRLPESDDLKWLLRYDSGKCHCGKMGAFNYSRFNWKLMCGKHRDSEMIRIGKKCEECNRIPTYGFLGERAKWCKEHKKQGSINLVTKTCEYSGCKKNAVYGNGRPTHCSVHKTNTMYKSGKKCAKPKCIKMPRYGFDKILYCHKHKKEGMIDIKRKRCKFEGCNTFPCFGYQKSRGIYCVKHKKDDMKNIFVVICKEPKCDRVANYGTIYNRRIWCRLHAKKNNGIRVVSCEKCKQPAVYNSTNVYPAKRCERHKLESDIHLYEHECRKCGLDLLLFDNGLCNWCNNRTKRVEPIIVESIKNKFKKIVESEDHKISGGCSRRRPDLVLDGGLYKIVIEVDEHQHKNYNSQCEKMRMFQIHQDFGGFQVLFIRFNPDKYVCEGKPLKLDRRVKYLKDWLMGFLKTNKMEHNIMIGYMFYDGFVDVKLEPLNYKEIGIDY